MEQISYCKACPFPLRARLTTSSGGTLSTWHQAYFEFDRDLRGQEVRLKICARQLVHLKLLRSASCLAESPGKE